MKINFLTPSEARAIFSTPDSYAVKLPLSNREMVNPENPTLEGYQEVFLNSFDTFTEEEKESIESFGSNYLSRLNVEINMIKTDGSHSLDITQTRGNSILSTHGYIGASTFVHEVYHILSRQYKLTDSLAKIWGFEKGESQDIQHPAFLLNPDAEDTNYKIEVTELATGNKIKVYPFILGGLRTGLKVDGEDRYLNESDTDYASMIKNTSYTAHPEEICAEHFAILVSGRCIFMKDVDVEVLGKFQSELIKLLSQNNLIRE